MAKESNTVIPLGDIYDKDVNFLFGSGASSSLLPTLQLDIKREIGGENWTLEGLATHFEKTNDSRFIPLFMHYYHSHIRPAETLTLAAVNETEGGRVAVDNYRRFLESILVMLQRRKALERRCNIFTTNYDGCFPLVADEVIQRGHIDFVLNDGTRGFTKRTLQARNFNSFLCQSGVFGRHQSSIPQINLIHLHGSVYWSKVNGVIQVDYDLSECKPLLDKAWIEKIQPFSAVLANSEATLGDLVDPN
jgi:hypothetical protein